MSCRSAVGELGFSYVGNVLRGAVTLLLPIALCGVGPAAAQVAGGLSPDERGFLEKLALARARTQMLERVRDLPLKEGASIGVWAGRVLARDRALHLWVRTLPVAGAPRIYSDGVGEVDVRLLPDELAGQLVRIAEQHPGGPQDALAGAEVESARVGWAELWTSGSAELVERGRTRKPDGWEDIAIEGVEIARRAAAADATYALLDEAARLRLTAAHRLSEFIDSSEDVRTAVLAGIQRSATIRAENAPDQVAVAEARLPMSDLIRILTEVHQSDYEGGQFEAADFREMALLERRDALQATGLASAPDRYIQRSRFAALELDAPAWAEQTLSADGRYVPQPQDVGEPESLRIDLARIDGIDALRKKVETLVIREGITVESYLAYHTNLKPDVVVFLGGARVVGKPQLLADGGVQVRLEVSMQRLWQILRRAMKTVEVDLPSSRPASGPSSQPAPEIQAVG